MRRVVLDTNVVVSGLRRGRVRAVLDLWRYGQFVLCVSEAIAEEYLEVIERFPSLVAEAPWFVALLREGQHTVCVRPMTGLRRVSQDPDDDMFLICAVAARADAIVSGDQHLLRLGGFEGIPILGPAAFLTLWHEGSRP